jgi:hypothetical protein
VLVLVLVLVSVTVLVWGLVQAWEMGSEPAWAQVKVME